MRAESPVLRPLHELVRIYARILDDSPKESSPDLLPGVHRDDGPSAIRMTEDKMASVLPKFNEAECFESPDHASGGQGPEPRHGSDLDCLHSNECDRRTGRLSFSQIRFDRFANPKGQITPRARLRVAPWKLNNGGHEVAVFVAFDDSVVPLPRHVHLERRVRHKSFRLRRLALDPDVTRVTTDLRTAL